MPVEVLLVRSVTPESEYMRFGNVGPRIDAKKRSHAVNAGATLPRNAEILLPVVADRVEVVLPARSQPSQAPLFHSTRAPSYEWSGSW